MPVNSTCLQRPFCCHTSDGVPCLTCGAKSDALQPVAFYCKCLSSGSSLHVMHCEMVHPALGCKLQHASCTCTGVLHLLRQSLKGMMCRHCRNWSIQKAAEATADPPEGSAGRAGDHQGELLCQLLCVLLPTAGPQARIDVDVAVQDDGEIETFNACPRGCCPACCLP